MAVQRRDLGPGAVFVVHGAGLTHVGDGRVNGGGRRVWSFRRPGAGRVDNVTFRAE